MNLDISGEKNIACRWNGRSCTDIARERRVRRNTVYGVIKRYNERGTLVSGRSTGHPRLTTVLDNRQLCRMLPRNGRLSTQRVRRK